MTISDLETLYKSRARLLRYYATSMIGSEEDSREIVDDVFLAVWNNRDRIDMSRNVEAYLKRSVRNRCINHLKKRRLQLVESGDDLIHDQQMPSADELIHIADLELFIYESIEQLPPKCREIFIMSRDQKLSHKEIAQNLGLSAKTVENQISIALNKLRKMFDESPFDYK